MTNTMETRKQVVVAGLGMTGQACLRFLLQQGQAVKAWDSRTSAQLPDDLSVVLEKGEVSDTFFNDVQEMVVSPGISVAHPVVEKARREGVSVIGDVELFSRYNKARLAGITGSNGKTTVTLLTTHILNTCGLYACAAGNVGKPVLDTLGGGHDIVVLELSSFQLETVSSLPLDAACIMNISDDHLDRHGTLAAYQAAKQRIYNNATHAVVWREQRETYPQQADLPVTTFGLGNTAGDFGVSGGWITWQGEPVLDLARVQLTGMHNALNIQASLALVQTLGVKLTDAVNAVYSFSPVPHRCTVISQRFGITWVDDSKATNIGAAIAALEGLAPMVCGRIILIAGGDAKGADLTQLAPALKHYVAELITLGRDGKSIAALHAPSEHVGTMKEAVAAARRKAASGDMVLLSPACSSLDMFDNYEHRAAQFAREIEELAA